MPFDLCKYFSKMQDDIRELSDWLEDGVSVRGHYLQFDKEAMIELHRLLVEYAERLILASEGLALIDGTKIVTRGNMRQAPNKLHESMCTCSCHLNWGGSEDADSRS